MTAAGHGGGRVSERVADCFTAVLATDPDREALVTRSGRWTYAQLDDLSGRAAQVWLDLGVRPGERVAASLPNDVDIIAAFHGAMRVGAIWLGVNQVLASPEQAWLLGDAGASVLLSDAHDRVAGAHTAVDLGDWRARIGTATPLRELPPVDPHAPAALAYTSGTTGRPKGAVHSQHNLLVPAAVVAASRGYGPDLRKGDNMPCTILNLMVLTTLLCAAAGGTSVLMDQSYAPVVAEWIAREQVTVWNGAPALLHSLAHADDIAPDRLRSLRETWSGGAALPETLRRAFTGRFGVPVVGTYGLTEAPTIVSIDPVDGRFAPGASGRVLPHLDVRVAPDGELCLAAAAEGPFAGWYTPPLGYWQRPEASAELSADDVVHTGDIGFVDDDGWLHVIDRRNLVIIRGGANVYPAEVERVLAAVDGVAGCAVLGVDDERLGERVVAAVEADAGVVLDPDALAARCRRELARYKVPERFLVFDVLPRNAMGKVDRGALRDRVSSRVTAEEAP
jgi:acyl-CoA synthetase (AMP-forming)/AMP-acid ligase II